MTEAQLRHALRLLTIYVAATAIGSVLLFAVLVVLGLPADPLAVAAACLLGIWLSGKVAVWRVRRGAP